MPGCSLCHFALLGCVQCKPCNGTQTTTQSATGTRRSGVQVNKRKEHARENEAVPRAKVTQISSARHASVSRGSTPASPTSPPAVTAALGCPPRSPPAARAPAQAKRCRPSAACPEPDTAAPLHEDRGHETRRRPLSTALPKRRGCFRCRFAQLGCPQCRPCSGRQGTAQSPTGRRSAAPAVAATKLKEHVKDSEPKASEAAPANRAATTRSAQPQASAAAPREGRDAPAGTAGSHKRPVAAAAAAAAGTRCEAKRRRTSARLDAVMAAELFGVERVRRPQQPLAAAPTVSGRDKSQHDAAAASSAVTAAAPPPPHPSHVTGTLLHHHEHDSGGSSAAAGEGPPNVTLTSPLHQGQVSGGDPEQQAPSPPRSRRTSWDAWPPAAGPLQPLAGSLQPPAQPVQPQAGELTVVVGPMQLSVDPSRPSAGGRGRQASDTEGGVREHWACAAPPDGDGDMTAPVDAPDDGNGIDEQVAGAARPGGSGNTMVSLDALGDNSGVIEQVACPANCLGGIGDTTAPADASDIEVGCATRHGGTGDPRTAAADPPHNAGGVGDQMACDARPGGSDDTTAVAADDTTPAFAALTLLHVLRENSSEHFTSRLTTAGCPNVMWRWTEADGYQPVRVVL